MKVGNNFTCVLPKSLYLNINFPSLYSLISPFEKKRHLITHTNTIKHVESDGGGEGCLFKGSIYSIFGCLFGGGCLLIRAWVHTVFEEIQGAKTKD